MLLSCVLVLALVTNKGSSTHLAAFNSSLPLKTARPLLPAFTTHSVCRARFSNIFYPTVVCFLAKSLTVASSETERRWKTEELPYEMLDASSSLFWFSATYALAPEKLSMFDSASSKTSDSVRSETKLLFGSYLFSSFSYMLLFKSYIIILGKKWLII